MSASARRVAFALLALGALGGATHCTLPADALPARCAAIEVDPDRELVIMDGATLADPALAFAAVVAVAGGAPEPLAGLDLELVAITNRIDLATLGGGRRAEMRFVYGAVAHEARLPLSVIVEVALPETRSLEEWARAWHGLGSLEGPSYQLGMKTLAHDVLAAPARGQIRIQDGRTTPPVLTEWRFADGALARSGLANTPPPTLDVSAFVAANQDAVDRGAHVLPPSMLAAAVTTTPPVLMLDAPAPTRDAFARATCNGCHTAEATVDGTFHVSPLRRGPDALSPFVRERELPRRADVLRGLLCR